MFLAPLVLVLAILAVPLWPVVVVIVGVAWCVVAPLEAAAVALKWRADARASATLKRWFFVVLKPWNYFDVPEKKDGAGPTKAE
jgi:hypothetical protein